MSVVTMSYVICDVCGAPATQPVEGGFPAARRAVPRNWSAAPDLCPDHRPTPNQPDGGNGLRHVRKRRLVAPKSLDELRSRLAANADEYIAAKRARVKADLREWSTSFMIALPPDDAWGRAWRLERDIREEGARPAYRQDRAERLQFAALSWGRVPEYARKEIAEHYEKVKDGER